MKTWQFYFKFWASAGALSFKLFWWSLCWTWFCASAVLFRGDGLLAALTPKQHFSVEWCGFSTVLQNGSTVGFLGTITVSIFIAVVNVVVSVVFSRNRVIAATVFVYGIIISALSLLFLTFQLVTLILIRSWFFAVVAPRFRALSFRICDMLAHRNFFNLIRTSQFYLLLKVCENLSNCATFQMGPINWFC